MTVWIWLLTIALLLGILVLIALKSRGVTQILIIVQVAYWSVSYLVRPLVLLFVDPSPALNDSVADIRLAYYGYDQSLPSILAPVSFGLFCYIVIIGLLLVRINGYSSCIVAKPISLSTNTVFVVAYFVGWFVRIYGADGSNPVLAILMYLGTIGAAGLLIFGQRDRKAMGLISSILILELIWSLLSASKTPILAAVISIAIRFSQLGWDKRRKYFVAILGMAAVGGFSVLQSFKLAKSVQQDLHSADSAYPSFVAPFMSIIRRFDLLSSMTDAVSLGSGEWMTPRQEFVTAVQGLIPKQLLYGEKISAGSLWALEVRPASTGVINPDVSLADGFIAEGYALNGLVGIALGALFMAVLLLLASRLLQSNSIFTLSLGILLVTYPVLYERGIFGGLEVVGKALQAAAVVWALHGFFAFVNTPKMSSRSSGNRGA